MKPKYNTRQRKLLVELTPEELRALPRGEEISAILHCNHPNFHEKTISLSYHEETNSPYASIISQDDELKIRINSKNYVALSIKKQTVTGQCSDRHLNFSLEIKVD